MKLLCKLGLRCLVFSLCVAATNCFALDREAFSFTRYDLTLQVDPVQHRLGVRGRVALRNDTQTPQKIAVLQISSSLNWRSIRAGDKVVQFVTQPLTSDVDHTGALSEAIVTLPQEVAPKATIDLTIAYEGVIPLDTTRLTRVGMAEVDAKSADWDQIGENFTAVRGAGYVAWYPIATEVANLSENDLSEVLGRWKARESEARMNLLFESTEKLTMLFSGNKDLAEITSEEGIVAIGQFSVPRMGKNTPAFVLAGYKKLDVKGLSTIYFLPGNEAAAASYAELIGGLDPVPVANGPNGTQVAELPDAAAEPFVADGLVLTPMKTVSDEDRRMMIYALARRRLYSSYPWITEGIAHFAQVMDIEEGQSRKAALDYLAAHQQVLGEAEKQFASREDGKAKPGEAAGGHSLIQTTDESYLQVKAMFVWWMLRDMVGGVQMDLDLSQYAEPKEDPDYLQKLFEKRAQRDLQWFFDDWVYHDHGLPDFKVESAFPSKTATNSYMVAVTVSNFGTAGAEVPVKIKFPGGETTKRLEVRAKSKGTIRIEVPAAPQEVVVNDGSVPESDMTNNTFKIEQAAK